MEVKLTKAITPVWDDTITVRRRMNNTFLVRYTEFASPNSVWVNTKTSNEVIEYFDNILTFFRIGHYSHDFIEVKIPGSPNICINHDNFDEDVQSKLLNSIEKHIQNEAVVFRE
jgi:hypothetical protein